MSFQGAANQPGGELASPAGDGPPLFRVSQSPGKGMGLFATRDIKAGTVVLREKFTLSVPGKNNGGYSRLDLDAIVKLTLQYNNLSQDTRAELLQLHATPMPHRDADVRNLITAADRHAGVPPMGERAVETCQRIVGVWLTNGFLTSDERTGTCLFLKASRINHSCVANTARYFEKNDPRYITIRATRDIKADEEITLTYADALLPVAERQEKTRRVWHFTCACPACDPNDPAIDSAAHERDIRDLQSLENDPTPGSEASREELSAALERSSRRIELHQKLLSSPAQLATE
ncbi:Uu.00g066830.m01.CDS01 [Anthostomella pinea]|uniref:Uu.00g066830.m01.CDS01 n=1 Tax=Anthostomella pinea TaxID=933095 RepID=A0AAI8YNA6_9PEZI|nr:Uu.00g066830.m01.CDS01 [Anthostomella pinea]